MVFQAVAEYRTQVKDKQNFNLDVELSVAGRSKPVRWSIKKDNAHLTRSDRVRSHSSTRLKLFAAHVSFFFVVGLWEFSCSSSIIFIVYVISLDNTFTYLYYIMDLITLIGGDKQGLQCDCKRIWNSHSLSECS